MAQAFDSQGINIILLFLVLTFIYLILKQLKKSYHPSLPPGPTPWPILGNLHQLKSMSHITLANLAQSYGPLMLLRLGTQILIVGSSPSAAIEILKTNDRILSARPVPHSVPLTKSQIKQMSFWADPLSDHWKNIRTSCRTELFSSKSLESQANLRERKIMEMVEFLRLNEGIDVNVHQIVFATVLNMFSNVLFSKDVVGLDEELGCNKVRGFLRGIIEAISAPNLSDFYPLILGKFDVQGLRKKHREMSMKMCALWETIVEERRKMGKDGLRDQDFLDTLIYKGFTDDQINKLFEELFQAGIDTTTSTINRTMIELLNNPESMTKLKKELVSKLNQHFCKESDLEALPYLQACVKETLRLHPPAPLLLSHRALETCQVMNYTVPKNARVLVNVWAIARDPTVWKDPLEYRPERFLESTLDFKGNDFEFLPFGAGRRICPGLPMAAKIVPLVVASLIHFHDWSLPEGNAYETLEMVQPLLLTPTARK
ncbi:hypothetical protein BUALT_Bualt10G0039500 [Buddleja alternifolia]|uniref:Cytochrome P450 n=1 Tax=Buddleja alternifolia TaxID=168488 RepID=A0AAV6X6N0_9LAMI|nr:hypothetical protein BUALT_Bualt10G0039500 [Buddleja alternifolia]